MSIGSTNTTSRKRATRSRSTTTEKSLWSGIEERPETANNKGPSPPRTCNKLTNRLSKTCPMSWRRKLTASSRRTMLSTTSGTRAQPANLTILLIISLKPTNRPNIRERFREKTSTPSTWPPPRPRRGWTGTPQGQATATVYSTTGTTLETCRSKWNIDCIRLELT
mgnify:CR=1 FL=1